MKKSSLRAVLIGPSESGKSFLALALVLMLTGKHRPYGAVFDPHADYVDALTAAGWHHQPITEADAQKAIDWSAFFKHFGRVVFEPHDIHNETLRGVVDKVAFTLRQLQNAILVLDEGKWMLPRHQAPEYAKLLYTAGRHGFVDVITVCQRAQNIDMDALTQAKFWLVFGLTYRDRHFIAAQLGIEADDLQELGRHEFLFIDPNAHKVRKYPASWLQRQNIPELWRGANHANRRRDLPAAAES